MRVLICGGRDYADIKKMVEVISHIHESKSITLLIDGGAKGADMWANSIAKGLSIPTKTYPADWTKYGKKAGPIRNRQMITEGKPDLVVAFPGGRGTANMIKQAQEANIETIIVGES